MTVYYTRIKVGFIDTYTCITIQCAGDASANCRGEALSSAVDEQSEATQHYFITAQVPPFPVPLPLPNTNIISCACINSINYMFYKFYVWVSTNLFGCARSAIAGEYTFDLLSLFHVPNFMSYGYHIPAESKWGAQLQ